MSATKRHAYFSPEEYLQIERISPIAHEYLQGQIVAMAGASKAHMLITGNLSALLVNPLRSKGSVRISIIILAGLLIGMGWTAPLQAQAPPLLQQAQTALQAGQYTEAETLWQQVVERSPRSAESHYNLGVARHHQYHLTGAIAAYQDAITHNPHHSNARINLALALIQTGQFEAATTQLQTVLTLPDHPTPPATLHTLAHYNLALIHKRDRQFDPAQREIEQAIAISPTFEPALQLLRQIQREMP